MRRFVFLCLGLACLRPPIIYGSESPHRLGSFEKSLDPVAGRHLVRQKLAVLKARVGTGENGRIILQHLRIPLLDEQLTKQDNEVSLDVLNEVLDRFLGEAPFLKNPVYNGLKESVEHWVLTLNLPKIKDLANWIRKEKINPPRTTHVSVRAAWDDVHFMATEIDRGMDGSETSNGWRKYLFLNDLLAVDIQKEEPSLNLLNQVESHVYKTLIYPGAPKVVGLEKSLSIYRVRRTFYEAENSFEQYAQHLERLAVAIEGVLNHSNRGYLIWISEELDWLWNLDQSHAVVEAVRSFFSKPNFSATLSRDLIATFIEGPISSREPIGEMIRGAWVSGSGDVTATPSVRLVDNSEKVQIQIEVNNGKISSATEATKPGMFGGRSWSSGTDSFWAKQFIFWDPLNGFSLSMPKALVSPGTQPYAARANFFLFRAFGKQAAFNKAQKEHEIGKWIAADRSSAKIATKMNDQSQEFIRNMNDMQKNVNTLFGSSSFPIYEAGTKTLGQTLSLTQWSAAPFQLGAAQAAPVLKSKADLVLQVHESSFSNLSTSFARRIFEPKDFGIFPFRNSVLLEGDQPAKDVTSKPFAEKASFRFTSWHPLHVFFDVREKGDEYIQEMTFVFRFEEVKAFGKTFKDIQLSVSYELLEPDEKGTLEISRQEESIFLIPGRIAFTRDEQKIDAQLTELERFDRRLNQGAFRDLLTSMLPDTMPLELPSLSSAISNDKSKKRSTETQFKLKFSLARIDPGGWLSIGMNKTP